MHENNISEEYMFAFTQIFIFNYTASTWLCIRTGGGLFLTW